MMNLDYSVIKSIIKDLDKSIVLHIDSIENNFKSCYCPKSNSMKDQKCVYCQLKEVIDDLDCLKSHLKPIAKNTVNSIQFIDVESFCYTLGKQSNIDSISIEPKWASDSDYRADLTSDQKPIGFDIFVKYSRYTMDGNGYHVGYENVKFNWKAINKRELGITGIPYLLSSWVVNPNEFEIKSKDLPDNDDPEHDPECEFKDDSDSFDDCSCADSFEGYFQPEDDFFYTEMNHILEQCDWIEAEFSSDTREWQLGFTSFNLNEYQNEPDYKDSCNEDDGRPSFGDY
jgi:hypothetical protein